MSRQVLSPQIIERDAFEVLGIEFSATAESDFGVFWRRYALRLKEFEGRVPEREAYAVAYGFDAAHETFTYLTGFEFDGRAPVPQDWTVVELPAETYAAFETTLDRIDETIDEVHTEWLPNSRYERVESPKFEYYDPGFDADDPASTFSFFVPIRAP
jgi:predicted transcriptional regulator YdeE